ncbi:MAG: hypothetical protein J1F07_04050 [Muribaculaceae bacterium]|nr:hypothetical protein [Muribaculaceae bacterium]
MKKIFLLIFLCLSFHNIQASKLNEYELSYYPVVVGNGLPEDAKLSLIAKMEQAMTQNGIGNLEYAERFVILAKCNVVEKNIVPTTPPRISQTVEVTFLIGDALENIIFASATFDLKGIGTNEHKAWQSAFNNLNSSNPQFKDLFNTAKERIEDYYSENCQSIITQAKTLASTGEYDEAISLLVSVPAICKDCLNEAQSTAITIYNHKIDSDGLKLLSKAKNAWAINPSMEGAQTAISFLDMIPVNSAAFDQGQALVETMSASIQSDKNREYEKALQEYKDKKEFQRKEQANSHARAMATIAACRSVAEKRAENQHLTKVYLNW